MTATPFAEGATVAPPQEKHTYYSRAGNLVFGNVVHGKWIKTEGDRSLYVGEEQIEFRPMGNSKFGCFTTDSPALIEFLEEHMRKARALGQICDVLSVAEYNAEIIPADTQIHDLRAKLERQLEENNRLLAKIAAQQAQSPPTGGPPRPPVQAPAK